MDEVETIQAEAVAAGLIVPLGDGRAAKRLWRGYDLASMVEGALHVELDPRSLGLRKSRAWLTRLRGSYASPPFDEDDLWFARPYWLLHDGRRVGTIKLGRAIGGPSCLPIYSLYVERPERARGVATRVLCFLADSCVRHGLGGIRLGTHWTWQRSLQFYLSRGFWVWSWKHDVQLVLQPELPERRFAIVGDTATLDISRGRALSRALTAHRDGDRLDILEASWLRARTTAGVRRLAVGTFAMSLALAGWPLVRSEEHWKNRFAGWDVGEPEGLACRIGAFEDVASEDGWIVETPVIPGLDLWQAWARGEDHGRRREVVRSIAIVLAERGLKLGEARRRALDELDDPWRLESLLRAAATARSLKEWWAHRVHG